ncbi:hypothetical protein ACLOAV_004638 [Pseudogymnoascus australis]
MLPEEIPYGQYTHIMFSFATINPSTFKVSAGDYQTEYMMSRIGAIKFLQPDIKIWVALGGWAFNDPGPTQTTFSDIASSTANINIFLDSLVQMMNKYGFDGVDIDWEYPVAEDRHGRPEDYKNIFNIMSYDMHGSWDIDNEWIGPWANSHTNMTDIQMALDLLWRNDISPSKVTMGMAFYSRSFTLTDPACNSLGCRVSSGGNPGKYSDTVGVLLHAEIQEIIAEKKLTPVLDRVGAVKTVSWGNQWASFDDVVTWRLKANIARSQCIEGFMVWAMSQDDEKGTNIRGLNQALGRKTPDFPDFTPIEKPVVTQPMVEPKLCRWSGCFEGCPVGFKTVQRDGYDELMMDADICGKNNGISVLCCPSDQPLPTCHWRGHRNTGNCRPGCEAGEFGPPKAGAATIGAVAGSRGNSAAPTRSAAFNTDCKWFPKSGHLNGENDDKICEGQCPKDSVQLSLTLGSHSLPGDKYCVGYNAFCCPDFKYIVPRGDDFEDSVPSTNAKEFQSLFDKYIANPTCPATVLDPPVHSDRIEVTGKFKRSLVAEAQEYEILQGRATHCFLVDWKRMLTILPLMFVEQNTGFNSIRNIWDKSFAGEFGIAFQVATLALFLAEYPWLDWSPFFEYILLNPYTAAQGMKDMVDSGTQLCQLVTAPESKRDLSVRSEGIEHTKRIVWPNMRGRQNNVPSLLSILRGIQDGHLTLHYARWQYMNGSPAGPLLELAYWIGPIAGTVPTDVLYNQYRDTTTGATRDNWVD